MNGKRIKLSKQLEIKLKQHYGGKTCVVTGAREENGVNIHWAHLDENPSHTTFDNIIPLSSGFNLTQEEWRRNKEAKIDWFNRIIILKASHLFFKARQHFQQGLPALAYGCSRLGQVLSLNYPKEFEAMEGDVWAFFCQNLYYLPYKMEYELLESVLLHLDNYLDLGANCPSDLKAGLLLALANIYQDNGLWQESNEIYSKLQSGNELPSNVLAATYRRQAVGSIFSNQIAQNSEYSLSKAYDLNSDFDFRTSIDIAKAWKNLIDQSPKEALSILESYGEIFTNPKIEPIEILSPHNIFELAFTQSAALLRLGKSFDNQIEVVNRLHTDAPHTRLRPVFTDHISKLTFDERIYAPISTLSMHLVFTKKLLLLLNIVTQKLLAISPISPNGRHPWVD